MSPSYAFVCNVFQDCSQLLLNLPALRQCYPQARVVLISDGDSDPRYGEAADLFGCEFVSGEHLYDLRCGGRVLARLFDVFLSSPGDYLVKFDSDTRFFRPFTIEPPGPASGCLWGAYGCRYIQGGCRILSRATVERLVKSGIVSGTRYLELESWCPPTAEEYYKGAGRVSDDFILRDALLETGVDIQDHPEVFSAGNVKRWRAMDVQTLKGIINRQRRFAVTHPWKLADLKWAARVAPLLSAAVGELGGDILNFESDLSVSLDSSLAE